MVTKARITWYRHHGNLVAVMDKLKGKHREHCLCFQCGKFIPDSETGELNCHLAEQNYQTCIINKMVMPVYECPEYEDKEES